MSGQKQPRSAAPAPKERRMVRYITVASCFALIWASIQYTQGRITDLAILATDMVVFVILGSVLCWTVEKIVHWIRNRR